MYKSTASRLKQGNLIAEAQWFDRLTRWLSLLFSVYSPLYNVMAFLEWLMLRVRGRVVLLLTVPVLEGVSLFVPSTVQEPILASMGVMLLLAFMLQVAWARAMEHYTLSLLACYPLHPALRSRVCRFTGYTPGGDLYEVHVSPKAFKAIESDHREIIRRTQRDAERITLHCAERSRQFAISGVTYTGGFGRVGYHAVQHLLQEAWCGRFPPRFGQRLLYPGKSWSGFVWVNR
ncbi:MAG: hypothetical protein K6T63_13075 [Alicyclobacillus herbarius]|uniref:hypothetical protein n=1 Tax=Alicyclobacillus TaxID=29330 RepID=UPI000831351C|nr:MULTISPECIES: hypothetical protein [Alicyclobacillus]MCL6633549.1 hypothetical protein [Alicyclobacillus herbarius]